ncbi:uncharacterized protein LOC130371116 [Gadus chalcogrammus]|uniref:uncharacterized protein LOC130371116 n=1 Tax=Gadus chalcogrammus TaxID=1042646 RepID=UPI0024C4E06B|nr:uncharacterized protein LOC130371116 [Gadus chalcogrammus]XP_056432741.1 uncharacterized protein LOC130371116 [Gadus chalcogrammus]
MLFKVQYHGKKKYIKLNGDSHSEFLKEAKVKFSISTETDIYVLDDTGTEVDEEVFTDILEEKTDILWTIVDVLSVSDSPVPSSCNDTLSLSSPTSESDTSLMSSKRWPIDNSFLMSPKRQCTDDTILKSTQSQHIDDSSSQAKELVKRVLEQKPGGEKILKEYAMRGEFKDRTRRELVNIIVADMVEKYGRAPPKDKRTQYAWGIVTLFPSLKDPYSKKGYEHFYDADSNEGYIAWKLKNTQRDLNSGSSSSGFRRMSSHTSNSSGPQLEREVSKELQLEGDQCCEAISLLKHSTDKEQIFMKMKATFNHRQQLIHDPEQCSTVLTLFPRFLDTKGLVLQDFDLLFSAETSSKLLEKWGTLLKVKVIEQAKNLNKTPLLDYLIQSAEENPDEDDEVPGWDSDMASLLLLVHLLPPTPSGKKGAVKLSIREAVDRVVKFHKSSRSLQEHSGPDQRRQPYILAVGTARNSIHQYYIAMDNGLLPCNARSSLAAFDELFKAHYVFGVSYDQALNSMFTFVQTTIYNIDIGLSHETPRVKDLRAKLLN